MKKLIYLASICLFLFSCDKKYLAKDNVIYLGRVNLNYDSPMKFEGEFRADDSNKDKKGYKFTLINDSSSFVIYYNHDKTRKEITGYFYGEFNTMRFLKGEKIGEDFIFEIIDQDSPGTTYLQFGSIYLTQKK